MTTAMDLEFNRLNACREISEAFQNLAQPASNCAPPTHPIERGIRDFTANSGLRQCFLRRPPVAGLKEFRCFRADYKETKTLACYREVSASLISEYRAGYDQRYIAESSRYIEQAKRCPDSNGLAGRAQETMFPPMLLPVAKHGFGFDVQYGRERPGTSMVRHGYATTSPSMARHGIHAIEYLVFSEGMDSTVPEYTSIGNWRVSEGIDSQEYEPLIASIRRQGVLVSFVDFDISIERAPLAPPRAKTPAVVTELGRLIAKKLVVDGFRRQSDEDLIRLTGMSSQEFSEASTRTAAFGARNTMRDMVGTPRVQILLKEKGAPCTIRDEGLIMALIFEIDGNKEVAVKFGSLTLALAGFGACASSAQGARAYMRNLLDESRLAVLDDLQRRQ